MQGGSPGQYTTVAIEGNELEDAIVQAELSEIQEEQVWTRYIQSGLRPALALLQTLQAESEAKGEE